MHVLAIDIPYILLELFTRFHSQQNTNYRDLIELTLKSTAERIVYAQQTDSSNLWREMSDNSYRLLDYCISHHFLVENSKLVKSKHLDDLKVDVVVRGTHALFIFETS